MDEEKELRIGVIGAGGRGNLAHYAHRPEDGIKLVAASDIKEEALENFQKKFGKDTFVTMDYKKLLSKNDIDAIFVTSPDFCHEEHAVSALEAGKSVYLEKPMAITIEGCDKILETAKKTKSKLFLGHNMRYMNVMRKMKELVDNGKIGEVKTAWCRHFIAYGGDSYFKDWHSERRFSTGLLLHKGTHDIDIIHWICGSYTKRVTAFGGLTVYDKCERRHAGEEPDGTWNIANWPPLSQNGMDPMLNVEDQSMVLMEMGNGIFACYLQCHFTPDAWRNYTFIGTEGRIENIGDGPEDTIYMWNRRSDSRKECDVEVPPDKVLGGSHGGADPLIVEGFLQFINGGTEPYSNPIAARYSVATGYQATMSLRNGGKPMEIPGLPEDIEKYFNNNQS